MSREDLFYKLQESDWRHLPPYTPLTDHSEDSAQGCLLPDEDGAVRTREGHEDGTMYWCWYRYIDDVHEDTTVYAEDTDWFFAHDWPCLDLSTPMGEAAALEVIRGRFGTPDIEAPILGARMTFGARPYIMQIPTLDGKGVRGVAGTSRANVLLHVLHETEALARVGAPDA